MTSIGTSVSGLLLVPHVTIQSHSTGRLLRWFNIASLDPYQSLARLESLTLVLGDLDTGFLVPRYELTELARVLSHLSWSTLQSVRIILTHWVKHDGMTENRRIVSDIFAEADFGWPLVIDFKPVLVSDTWLEDL